MKTNIFKRLIAVCALFVWQDNYTTLKSEASSNCPVQSNGQLKAKINWWSVAISDGRGAMQGGSWEPSLLAEFPVQ